MGDRRPRRWLLAVAAGCLVAGARTAAPATDDNDDESADTGVDLPLPPVPADPAEREKWLASACDAAVAAQPALAPADVGAIVLDVASGRVLWSHDPDHGLSLASVTKVVTTAAALHGIGPGFRWRTSVLGDRFDPHTGVVAGDLVLRPRGDPTLTMDGLTDLARQLWWKGVRKVDGDLVIDGSYFADDGPPPHFDDQPNERAGYRAPVASSSLERNAVTVVVVADRAGLGNATVRLDPPGGDYVRLAESAVVTVADGRSRIRVDTEVEDDHLTLRVSGQLNADDGVYFVRRRVDAPDRLLAAGFRAALADAGIKLRGSKLGHGPPPPTASLLAEHASVTPGEVVRELDKTSDNFRAETVLKTLGAEELAAGTTAPASAPTGATGAPPADHGDAAPAPGSATWADGQRAVARYLTDVVGLAPASFRIENGSGLYDATEISAHAVAQVLATAYRDLRVGPEMISALSIAGLDGTLRKRLAGPSVRGRVRGKTGTLAAVSSLAGYAGVDTGHPVAFAVIVNKLPAGQRPAARTLQDAIAAIAVRAAAGP
ncbi:MAG TPA: D-alanyl-D-alanine carboxypeptidase/D-alanyl-D-alanine-endopeptidase [Kofleriaceae bacterium]|nr:D-alanyl-D-alanine carboxypeptidase/D-alanyl-D-alanine-endopeptidase [Kofleriaceae bacterium]